VPLKVIFLPGLGCSKLYVNGNYLVPTIEGGIMNLKLDSVGNDMAGNLVEAKSILLNISDKIPVYGPLVNFFEKRGFAFHNANDSIKNGNTLYAFPYDFRKDIGIASNALERFVITIKEESKTNDVIIISHSMGNLVALDCILKPSSHGLVSKLVCIAPPFDGVPQVYASLNYGTEFPLPKTSPIGLDPKEFQALVVNWQGLYQLFPFNFYDDASRGFYSKQNKTLSLRETYEKSESLNQAMVSRAKSWKEDLIHKWEESDFKDIHLISGEIPENKTICHINENISSGTTNVSYGTCIGDGTIPKSSCEKISHDSNLRPIIHKYSYKGIDAEHNALTRNTQILEKIFSIIS